MIRFFTDQNGEIQQLLPGEVIPEGWVEMELDYRRYEAPNGDIHTIGKDATPGSDWVEISMFETEIPDPNFVIPYDAQRMNTYPSVGEQLDMLWHEISVSGSISTDGNWFKSIQSVKTNFPKE